MVTPRPCDRETLQTKLPTAVRDPAMVTPPSKTSRAVVSEVAVGTAEVKTAVGLPLCDRKTLKTKLAVGTARDPGLAVISTTASKPNSGLGTASQVTENNQKMSPTVKGSCPQIIVDARLEVCSVSE
ncbi:hypothetical protein GN958_ATG05022 [Phytophthora infestans]|uniref:Uncharacterized protein n=1 Tax=Phytophthora infestans TaxID=4787 RepID=A0A8S9UXG8_PHYIN|nr:hypothetical protein GN958_ATG05022 [Phytophthora infestans]